MIKLNPFQTIIYNLMLIFSDFLGMLPENVIKALSNSLAYLIWFFVPSRRKYTIEAIQKHLELDSQQAKELALASYKENCLSFIEITRVKGSSFKNENTGHNSQRLFAMLQDNSRPIVGVTGHFGSWELLAGIFKECNQSRQSQIVMRDNDKAPISNNYLIRQRQLRGAEVVGHRRTAPKILKCLKNNGITGFLVDHNSFNDKESLFLPFFNDIAAVNFGPALLALKTEAIVLPAFLVRNGNKRILEISEPLDTKTLEGTREEKIEAIARFYTKSVEDIIRKYPSQWFWMHHRWKARPRAEEA